ncbi:B12-binding domain-containing radical SAM protein [Acidobacteriota bacterium]
MKILLVDPPGRNKGLNTGLGYLSAVLEGIHEVSVLDLNNIELGLCGDPNTTLPIGEIERRIRICLNDTQPELAGISVKTFTVDVTMRIIDCIRNTNPKIKIIVGGPHVTLDGDNFIRKSGADIGVIGEGDHTILEVSNALSEGRSVASIHGIYFWDKDRLIRNQRTDPIGDLDTLPLPIYKYFTSVINNGGKLTEYPLLTSRGCPFNCTYCSMPKIMGKSWRAHSPERVIEELNYAKKYYECSSFTVVDDNLTLDLKRVEDICDRLISKRIIPNWNSQNGIRADRISAELAIKMRRAGCRYVWIGIESADEKVFAGLCKGEDLGSIARGIKHLKNAGIRVGGFFILGLPDSTKETDLKAVDFVKKHGIDGWWFNFVPYPQTEAWNWVQEHGKVLRPLEGALQYGKNDIEPVFETDEYPKAIRRKTYEAIHVKLKYFDRLIEPSLKQWDMWRQVIEKVIPYGSSSLVYLLIFMVKYNVRKVVGRVTGLLILK